MSEEMRRYQHLRPGSGYEAIASARELLALVRAENAGQLVGHWLGYWTHREYEDCPGCDGSGMERVTEYGGRDCPECGARGHVQPCNCQTCNEVE